MMVVLLLLLQREINGDYFTSSILIGVFLGFAWPNMFLETLLCFLYQCRILLYLIYLCNFLYFKLM